MCPPAVCGCGRRVFDEAVTSAHPETMRQTVGRKRSTATLTATATARATEPGSPLVKRRVRVCVCVHLCLSMPVFVLMRKLQLKRGRRVCKSQREGNKGQSQGWQGDGGEGGEAQEGVGNKTKLFAWCRKVCVLLLQRMGKGPCRAPSPYPFRPLRFPFQSLNPPLSPFLPFSLSLLRLSLPFPFSEQRK